MSANLTSLALNPAKLLHAAAHEVSPLAQPGSVQGLLFPDGGANVLSTPGAKSVTLTRLSNRGENRAGVDTPTDGMSRGAPRARLTMFNGTPLSSDVKKWGSEIEVYDEDILDVGNLDPSDQAAAQAQMRELELKSAQLTNIAHTRYWENDFYRLIAGPSLNFQSGTGFTSTAASAAAASMNPDDYNLANPLLDLPRFIQYMCRDLVKSTGGAALARNTGITLLVTPETVLAWGANVSLQGYTLHGTSGQGYTATQGNFLNADDVSKKIMAMSNGQIKGVIVMDSMQDTAALSTSAESLDFSMGSVIGMTALVQAPSNPTKVAGRTTIYNTAVVRHHFKSQAPRWVPNAGNDGKLMIADRWQAFKVINSAYGVSYYDA